MFTECKRLTFHYQTDVAGTLPILCFAGNGLVEAIIGDMTLDIQATVTGNNVKQFAQEIVQYPQSAGIVLLERGVRIGADSFVLSLMGTKRIRVRRVAFWGSQLGFVALANMVPFPFVVWQAGVGGVQKTQLTLECEHQFYGYRAGVNANFASPVFASNATWWWDFSTAWGLFYTSDDGSSGLNFPMFIDIFYDEVTTYAANDNLYEKECNKIPYDLPDEYKTLVRNPAINAINAPNQ